MRVSAALLSVNLILFIALTTLPAFRNIHHHWILPVLALLFAIEWRLVRSAAARGVLLWIVAFLMLMGIARHDTILRCFDQCSLKLAAAVFISGVVFWQQSRRDEPFFWNCSRSQLAAAAFASWAGYLFLFGLKLAAWSLEIAFVIVALLFWLGRANPVFFITSLGILIFLAIRRVSEEMMVIVSSVLVTVAGFIGLAVLEKRSDRPSAATTTRPISIPTKMIRTAGLLAVVLFIGVHAVGPILFMLEPGKRWERLTRLAPAFPALQSLSLPPLETRLKDHVAALAIEIGERSAYERDGQLKARDYVESQFQKAGYVPVVTPYETKGLYAVRDGTSFFNVEAVAGVGLNPEKGILIVSAHYDTAPGTPGADDNASGVAVLLEAARLLKDAALSREVRFVAFGTEEPPAFGTQNMGSYRYARNLREKGIRVEGLINLEMVGYFNPKKGSQLYPPFLHLFYPDHGNFIAMVGNFSSRKFLSSIKRGWPAPKDLPLETAVLPTVFSGVTLSDQLNFWNEGFHGVMFSDTSFFRNPHYHENTDTPEKLNYAKMAILTRSLVEVVKQKGNVVP